MGKFIYVQAQADHIASLAKATPVAAIEELVWNALDADAHEIRIDVLTNPLGAVEGVRVADDGTGIDVLKADSTFGSLGGSWKRLASETPAASRRLHGRHGRGRFKAFALGTNVEWRTTMRAGDELMSFVISGALDNPGVFEVTSAPPGPGTGTEVCAVNAGVNCDSLLNAAETVQTLASKFALYLKSYPDVRIYFNGLPVTPVVVQRRVTDMELEIEGGAKAKLEIIEWKRRFAGAGRLVFVGADGFELHSQACGVRSGGIPFTAYLVSKRFTALAAENALVMEELNAEVRAYVDAAKAALRKHFAEVGEESGAVAVEGWRDEGSYPFDGDDGDPKERKRFNALALELTERIDALRDMSGSDRKIIFGLLRHAMSSVKKGTLKEFLK